MASYANQIVDIGAAANDGNGDPVRTAFTKLNDNWASFRQAVDWDSSTFNVNIINNLGVGTLTPDSLLHVVSGSESGNPISPDSSVLVDRNVSDNNYIEFTGPAALSSFQGIIFSDDASNRGGVKYLHSSDELTLSADGADRVVIDDTNMRPQTTEVFDLGSAAKEYKDIFSQNAVTVCDENRKDDQGSVSSSPYIALMKALDPRIFTFKDSIVIEAKAAVMGERHSFILTPKESVRIVEVDGKFKEEKYIKTIKVFQYEQVLLYDDKGKLKTKKDKFGQDVQVYYAKPIMEEYEVEPAIEEKTVTHTRPHTGLMAQAVKAKMDALDIDWAGYAYYEEDDVHTLRLMEFIGPTLAYVQELEKRIEVFENA